MFAIHSKQIGKLIISMNNFSINITPLLNTEVMIHSHLCMQLTFVSRVKEFKKNFCAPSMSHDINEYWSKIQFGVISATWESKESQVATVSAVARLSPAYVLLGKLGAGTTVSLRKKLCPTLVLHRRRSWDPRVGMLIWDNLRRVSLVSNFTHATWPFIQHSLKDWKASFNNNSSLRARHAQVD